MYPKKTTNTRPNLNARPNSNTRKIQTSAQIQTRAKFQTRAQIQMHGHTNQSQPDIAQPIYNMDEKFDYQEACSMKLCQDQE